MLFLVGLGLNDEGDISLKGRDALRMCDAVYAELYTNRYRGDMKKLESIAGKDIVVLDREKTEEGYEILSAAEKGNVALLVPGDPMVATTHVSLMLKAKDRGIRTKVIHSSSIFSAIAETGLQIYKLGKTMTIVAPTKSYAPTSFYDVLAGNKRGDMHTLCLLDIDMTVNEGVRILLDIEKKKKGRVFCEDELCIGCARLGGSDEVIACGSAGKILDIDFGPVPHCLIIPSTLHFMEKDALKAYSIEEK